MRSSKKILWCIFAMGMVCGFSACGGTEIEPPDLTTEYVESGFSEYCSIELGCDPQPIVLFLTRCGYRTMRIVDETAAYVEVTLFYGGKEPTESYGYSGDLPDATAFDRMEVYLESGDEKNLINMIPTEEFLKEEYKIQSNSKYIGKVHGRDVYERQTEYAHSEFVQIPMSFFSEEEGVISFSVEGIIEEDYPPLGFVYDWGRIALYYTQKEGKIHFINKQEHDYLTNSSWYY